MSDNSSDRTTAHGASALYLDIPREYISWLTYGKLGEWLQEVHDAGWEVTIMPAAVWIYHPGILTYHEGCDDATHRVDVMILRAYLAWKGREG